MRRWPLIAVLALVLIAAACGSSTADTVTNTADDGEAPSAAVDESAEAQSAVDDATEPDDGNTEAGDDPAVEEDETPVAESSPIGAFFADGGGFDAALADYTARVNERIVVCMANQGFEFIPDSTGAGPGGGGAAQQARSELSERAWTEQWGFGISTSFESFASGITSNPNFALVAALSPAEREIWTDTLFGVGGGPGSIDLTGRPLD